MIKPLHMQAWLPPLSHVVINYGQPKKNRAKRSGDFGVTYVSALVKQWMGQRTPGLFIQSSVENSRGSLFR